MSPPNPIAALTHSISAAERDTGLGKDTLRVWERRYGFPLPGRDALGERVYSAEQIEKLRLLKRLLDRGFRPGKIIHATLEQLQQLGAEQSASVVNNVSPVPDQPEVARCLELCRSHQVEELRSTLSQALMRMGMQRFIVDVIAPMNRTVGELWVSGEFAVFEEHLYTEVVQNLLRYAISTIPQSRTQAGARPRITMTTFPQESHGLGLLMAEALFALEGARCISLGVQTPIVEIAQAARLQQADVVALSFSSAMNGRQVLDGLKDLAAALPPETEIWVGGNCPALARCSVPQVHMLNLGMITSAIADWRSRHEKA